MLCKLYHRYSDGMWWLVGISITWITCIPWCVWCAMCCVILYIDGRTHPIKCDISHDYVFPYMSVWQCYHRWLDDSFDKMMLYRPIEWTCTRCIRHERLLITDRYHAITLCMCMNHGPRTIDGDVLKRKKSITSLAGRLSIAMQRPSPCDVC